jgi:hypothetical protein
VEVNENSVRSSLQPDSTVIQENTSADLAFVGGG